MAKRINLRNIKLLKKYQILYQNTIKKKKEIVYIYINADAYLLSLDSGAMYKGRI